MSLFTGEFIYDWYAARGKEVPHAASMFAGRTCVLDGDGEGEDQAAASTTTTEEASAAEEKTNTAVRERRSSGEANAAR